MLQHRLRESVPGYKELKLKLPASSPEELKLRKSIRDKKYKSSEKGRATQKEYRSSEQGQAKQKEWMSSENGQARMKEAQTRYRSKPGHNANKRKCSATPKSKATSALYLASESGLRAVALRKARRRFKKSKTVDDNFELVDGKIQHAR